MLKYFMPPPLFVSFIGSSSTDEYINLMRLFEHRDEMYFDVCHYTDKAHEILADQVLKTIMQEVKKLKTGRVFLE